MNKYNSNNFKETISFVQQVFELCNGRINLTKKPKELRRKLTRKVQANSLGKKNIYETREKLRST